MNPHWEKARLCRQIAHAKGKLTSNGTKFERLDCKDIWPQRGLLTSHSHSICLWRIRTRRSVWLEVQTKPVWMEIWQRRAGKVRLLRPLFHGLVEARAMKNHLRAIHATASPGYATASHQYSINYYGGGRCAMQKCSQASTPLNPGRSYLQRDRATGSNVSTNTALPHPDRIMAQ